MGVDTYRQGEHLKSLSLSSKHFLYDRIRNTAKMRTSDVIPRLLKVSYGTVNTPFPVSSGSM